MEQRHWRLYLLKLHRGGLARIVSCLKSSTVDLGKSLGEFAGLAQGTFEENKASIVLATGAVQNLMSVLGPAVEMDAKFDPQLCGKSIHHWRQSDAPGRGGGPDQALISVLKDSLVEVMSLSSLSESKQPDEDEMLKMILIFVLVRVKIVTGDLELSRGHLMRLVNTKANKPEPAAKRQKVIQSKEGSVGRSEITEDLLSMLSNNKPPAAKKLPSDSETMEDELNKLVDKHYASRMEMALGRVAEAMRLLVADVGLSKASSKHMSVKFGGPVEVSPGKQRLDEDNFHNLRYGLMMDPLLMLDRIFGADDIEAESPLKLLESRAKLQITTGAEAAAIKTLHFVRHQLFHKGRIAMISERRNSKLLNLP